MRRLLPSNSVGSSWRRASEVARVGLLWVLIGCCAHTLWGADEQALAQRAVRMLRMHCAECHGDEEPAAGVRVDNLETSLSADQSQAKTWQRMLEMVETGQMPPAEAQPLPPRKRQQLVRLLNQAIERAIEARQQQGWSPGSARLLTRIEYANTLRELLTLDMDYTRDLPTDPASRDGFRNDSHMLQLSAEQLTSYLETARRALDRAIVEGPPPQVFRHVFSASNVKGWKGNVEFSNRLGRQQEFIAQMVEDYPEQGEFLIRVKLAAELRPDKGYPLLEVALGYRPDTQILFRNVALVEITSQSEQVLEFRGRVEEFPLPVRGQGKFPGLVVKLRNAYDDGSSLPKGTQDPERNKRWFYPEEPALPLLQIEQVEFVGPVFDAWPPHTHRQLLFASELRESNESHYAMAVLSRFMERAFRRPVPKAEVEQMLEFFISIRSDFPSFEAAMRETLAMVLIRPEFLYILPPTEGAMDDWFLASRLSYYLWGTPPDDTLRQLASEQRLHEPEVLCQQVERLLQDAKSRHFVEQFADQWLQLDRLDHISVDRERYSNFDERLKQDMRLETRHFFEELLRQRLSALNLLESDFVMINERMARHYQLPGVWGDSFRPVPVADSSHRGGLLGQSSILLANSTGSDSHPVRRAVWLRDRLLNDPPAPPPPDVPPLKEIAPNFRQMSVRQQLEVHRDTASCNRCHRSLDPWGIALENFDALGQWRETLPATEDSTSTPDAPRELPVDAVAHFPDGRTLEGVAQLRQFLVAEKSDDFSRALVERMLAYAINRGLDLGDHRLVDQLHTDFAQHGYKLDQLIQGIVTSPAFSSTIHEEPH
jgi:hypothetical protein